MMIDDDDDVDDDDDNDNDDFDKIHLLQVHKVHQGGATQASPRDDLHHG